MIEHRSLASALAVWLMAGTGCGGPTSHRPATPPDEAVPLVEFIARRDHIVGELLQLIREQPPGEPAMGNRLRAFTWLGRLRSQDSEVLDTLVDYLTTLGVPDAIAGSERDQEAFYPAALALSQLGSADFDVLLDSAFRSSDPLRHRLTAWRLRAAYMWSETPAIRLVSELDRQLGFRYHAAAQSILGSLLDPPTDIDPPGEIFEIWKTAEFEGHGREPRSELITRAEEVFAELRALEEQLVGLLSTPPDAEGSDAIRSWALWVVKSMTPGRMESALYKALPRLDWLPARHPSPWCTEGRYSWEATFPMAAYSAAVGVVSQAYGILEGTDPEEEPVLVRLATWIVVQSDGKDLAVATVRASSEPQYSPDGSRTRWEEAGDRVAAWKPSPVPPNDVLIHLGLSATQFRELCAE